MNEADDSKTPSKHAERAYELILAGMTNCQTVEEQHLLLHSLLCQRAVFSRMINGEQHFFELLEKLKFVDIDNGDSVLPRVTH